MLTVESTDTPLTVVVPPETTTLAMDTPFDALTFRAKTAQKVFITADAPAKLVVNQVGERRFVAGKVQIAMDDGKAAVRRQCDRGRREAAVGPPD